MIFLGRGNKQRRTRCRIRCGSNGQRGQGRRPNAIGAVMDKGGEEVVNINKKHFLLAGSCAVVRSVFSRSSLGKIGQGIRVVKETAILTKVLFWWLGVLWSFLGSSLVINTGKIRKVQRKRILIKVLFAQAQVVSP